MWGKFSEIKKRAVEGLNTATSVATQMAKELILENIEAGELLVGKGSDNQEKIENGSIGQNLDAGIYGEAEVGDQPATDIQPDSQETSEKVEGTKHENTDNLSAEEKPKNGQETLDNESGENEVRVKKEVLPVDPVKEHKGITQLTQNAEEVMVPLEDVSNLAAEKVQEPVQGEAKDVDNISGNSSGSIKELQRFDQIKDQDAIDAYEKVESIERVEHSTQSTVKEEIHVKSEQIEINAEPKMAVEETEADHSVTSISGKKNKKSMDQMKINSTSKPEPEPVEENTSTKPVEKPEVSLVAQNTVLDPKPTPVTADSPKILVPDCKEHLITIEKLSRQNGELIADLSTLTTQLMAAKASSTDANSKLTAAQTHITALSQQLVDSKKSLNATIAKQDKEITLLKEEAVLYKERIKTLQAWQEDVSRRDDKREAERLKRDKDREEKERLERERLRDKEKAEREKRDKIIDDLKRQVAELEAQNRSITDENLKLKDTSNDLQELVDNNEDERLRLEAEISKYKKSADELVKERERKKKEDAALQAQLKLSQDEVSLAKSALMEREAEVIKLLGDIEKLKAETSTIIENIKQETQASPKESEDLV